MTPLDWLCIAVILLLVVAVRLAWNGPTPPSLMRPAFTLRLGIDHFAITAQSTDGNWMKIVGTDELCLSQCEKGDVIFIEQPNGPTQMFYVNDVDHNRQLSTVYVVRDPVF